MVVITTCEAGLMRVRLEPLKRVKLRELAWVIWWLEVGELVFGLLAEIATIHEEKNSLGSAEFQKPISEIDGSESLTRACRHLNQCP